MEEVRLVDADPAGGVTWELKITDDYANQNGMLLCSGHICTAEDSLLMPCRRNAWRGCGSHLWLVRAVYHPSLLADVYADMGTTTALCPIARPGYWEYVTKNTSTVNLLTPIASLEESPGV